MSNHGHLCNEKAAELIVELTNDHLSHAILGHLSKENNYDELAFETVKLEIALGSEKYRPEDFQIEVAKRDSVSRMMEF